jgi:hypothetical protein
VRPRVLRTLLAAALLVTPVVAGCSLRPKAGPPPSPYCRSGPPLSGVYHASRLVVRSACRIAVGIVDRVKFEEFDGDVHVDLRLDDGYQKLLAAGNDRVGGTLVVEIIPQDRSVVAIPQPGVRVEVVGPWVDDTTHGWREIHPAWFVSAGRIVPATATELRRVQQLLSGAASDGDS